MVTGVQARNFARGATHVVRPPGRPRRLGSRRLRPRSGAAVADPGQLRARRSRRRRAGTCSTPARRTTRRPSGAGSTRPPPRRCRSSATPATATRWPTSASTRFIHMQYTGATGGVAKPARWEAAVQNGIYDVTVAVGDVGTVTGSTHRLTVESTNLVNNFAAGLGQQDRHRHGPHPGHRRQGDPRRGRRHQHQARLRRHHPGRRTCSAPGPRWPASTSGRPVHRRPTATRTTPAPPTRATRGYGWISQTDATPAAHHRQRARPQPPVPDQRLDTFMHMQFTGTSGGVAQPARWQYGLPDGHLRRHRLGRRLGHPGRTRRHRLDRRGHRRDQQLRPDRQRQVPDRDRAGLGVTDGFLTLDAAGGTNTKINYVEIIDADNTPRTITGADPANNATDVPLDTVDQPEPEPRGRADHGRTRTR